MFFINDIQILYYKSNKVLIIKIIKEIKDIYKLIKGKDVEQFLRIQVIKDYKE